MNVPMKEKVMTFFYSFVHNILISSPELTDRQRKKVSYMVLEIPKSERDQYIDNYGLFIEKVKDFAK